MILGFARLHKLVRISETWVFVSEMEDKVLHQPDCPSGLSLEAHSGYEVLENSKGDFYCPTFLACLVISCNMRSKLPLKQHKRSGTRIWDPEGYPTSQAECLLLAEIQERKSSLLPTAPPWSWRARGENSLVPIPPPSGTGVGVTLANNDKAVAES